MTQRLHKRTPGQALVEFALAATLIFFLLAASVDLGIIFFTMQGLRTAAQEGAAFGSYPVDVMVGGQLNRRDLNYPEIVNRVYSSGGTEGNIRGFANLRDLDNNGVDDMQQRLHDNMATNPNAFIYIENLLGTDPNNLSPACATSTPGVGLQSLASNCWIRVTVRYNYRFLFPLAPVFGDTVRLQVSQVMQIRRTFSTTR